MMFIDNLNLENDSLWCGKIQHLPLETFQAHGNIRLSFLK